MENHLMRLVVWKGQDDQKLPKGKATEAIQIEGQIQTCLIANHSHILVYHFLAVSEFLDASIYFLWGLPW
jgi:hypothetical protein